MCAGHLDMATCHSDNSYHNLFWLNWWRTRSICHPGLWDVVGEAGSIEPMEDRKAWSCAAGPGPCFRHAPYWKDYQGRCPFYIGRVIAKPEAIPSNEVHHTRQAGAGVGGFIGEPWVTRKFCFWWFRWEGLPGGSVCHLPIIRETSMRILQRPVFCEFNDLSWWLFHSFCHPKWKLAFKLLSGSYTPKLVDWSLFRDFESAKLV